MKRILGLDLGTNSIGWALVHQNFEGKTGNIEGIGSRIIPMSQDVLDTFSGGKPLETQTALRTGYRGVRRLRERHLLRRERLHRVLNVLGFLPKHFASNIDFSKRLGQFLDGTEPKLAYEGKAFIFKKSFFKYIPKSKTMLETLPMQNLIKINKLASYQHNGFWQCIDNRRDLETIKKLIKTRNAPWIKKI